jgi:hypothetical protein
VALALMPPAADHQQAPQRVATQAGEHPPGIVCSSVQALRTVAVGSYPGKQCHSGCEQTCLVPPPPQLAD